jgi:hypothetical protein
VLLTTILAPGGLALEQYEYGVPVKVGVAGSALTVTEIAIPALEQPEAFFTVNVPVYVAAAAPAGTVTPMGLAGSATLDTFVKPAVIAAALHTMLY